MPQIDHVLLLGPIGEIPLEIKWHTDLFIADFEVPPPEAPRWILAVYSSAGLLYA